MSWKKLASSILALALAAVIIPFTSPPALAAGETFITVAAGSGHTMAIKSDGSLWAWGANSYGQQGDGTVTPARSIPVKIMDDVVYVAAGYAHTLAIKSDQSLWAWGLNNCGQIGDGSGGSDPLGFDLTNDIKLSPVKIMDGVAAVAAGFEHSMAIKTDGSLWAWGRNSDGQLGNGAHGREVTVNTTPIRIMDGVASVSAGGGNTMIIKTDGSLWGWGMNGSGQLGNGTGGNWDSINPFPAKIMEGVDFVSSGGSQTMAIKNDGSLWVWGASDFNPSGEGSETVNATPVKIMDGVISASSGGINSMAIKADGSLWGWGYSARGQLGAGVYSSSVPVKIMDNVASVSASGYHTMAIKTDGSLWGWGDNRSGAVGSLEPEQCSYPVQIFAYGISVFLDGRRLTFDVPPYLVNGRTLVPLRVIFEELGASIVWDNVTKTVTATKGGTVVVLTIGDTSPTVNGQIRPIDQPMIAVNGRTLVPLRFVAEAFGVKVDWNPAALTVTITS